MGVKKYKKIAFWTIINCYLQLNKCRAGLLWSLGLEFCDCFV